MVRGPRASIDWSCDDDVVFSGPRIGVKRLHEIVRGKLDAHSMIKRNTKAGSSENTLKRLFQRFDKDRSGSIDMNEFFALLKTVGLQNINKNDATDLFTKYDSDGNGSLDFSEWCKIYGISTHISHEPGIIDMPSSRNDFFLGRKSTQEREALFRRDFANKLKENCVTAMEVFVECAGSSSGRAQRDTVKNIVRGKFGIGIGNESAMDSLLDRCCVHGWLDHNGFEMAFNVPVGKVASSRAKPKLFTGPPIGVDRLHQLVSQRMLKHSFLRGQMKSVSSPHTLARLFKEFDKDRSGAIDYGEFQAMISNRLGISTIHQSDVKALFDKYDNDGSGQLEYGEFANVFCDNFSTERGIIDLPSTRQDSKHLRMTAKQAVQGLCADFLRVCTERALRPEQLFRKCCTTNGNANSSATVSQVKRALRGKFGIGIGNEASLDKVLSRAEVQGNVTFHHFATELGLQSDAAKHMQTQQQQRRRKSQAARGVGGSNPISHINLDVSCNQNLPFSPMVNNRISGQTTHKAAPTRIDWSDVLNDNENMLETYARAPVEDINEIRSSQLDYDAMGGNNMRVCQTERAKVRPKSASACTTSARAYTSRRVHQPMRPKGNGPRRHSTGTSYKGRSAWLNDDAVNHSQAVHEATVIAQSRRARIGRDLQLINVNGRPQFRPTFR